MSGTEYTDDTRMRTQPPPSPWASMVLFAGVTLMLTGGFEVIEGVVMLARDDLAQATADALAIPVDFTFWGWAQLLIGVLAVLSGAGVLYGVALARITAVLIAVLSVFANVAMLPVYPFWCSIVIALNVLCIYAVAAHGREIRA